MSKRTGTLIVWLAQGFGIGRIPFAPGTWGSVLGIGWFLMLIATGNWWAFAVGSGVAALAAVYVCGRAEEIMQQRDPPSVVLDEIVAIPLCFTWICLALWNAESKGEALIKEMIRGIPKEHLLGADAWKIDQFSVFTSLDFIPWLGVGFTLFRLFDIWKPWPIRQSQRLPGGWGVVMDDVLAAVYVNLVMLAAWGVMQWAN